MTGLARWWFAPAPATRLAAVRMLVGTFALTYVFVRLGELWSTANLPATQFAPIGVTRVLAHPIAPELALVIALVTGLLLIAFTLGIGFRYVAPCAALGLLWVTSYRNSWGMVFHTENLLVLHVIALACTPAADAWALRGGARAPSTIGYGWALKLLAALTAATYVLAGIAKLRLAGMHWLDGELLRNQVAIDNLRKALLGDSIAPLATPLLDHPDGFIVFAIATLVIELGAPIVLLDGRFGARLGRLWALGAFGFHLGVVLMMNIWFIYPLSMIAFAPLFAVERPFAWVGAKLRKRTPGNAATPTAS